ncbi:unnamed protein product [Ectocarpus sp. 8 AP-2014]
MSASCGGVLLLRKVSCHKRWHLHGFVYPVSARGRGAGYFHTEGAGRCRRRFRGRVRAQVRARDNTLARDNILACFYLTTSVESGFLVDGSSGASREEGLALGAAGGRAEEGRGCAGVGCGEHGIGRVVPQEEQDGGWISLDVTGGRVEQQCRTDFCVPKYARDSFNLTTSVESGFLVGGSSGASREEGLALGAVG